MNALRKALGLLLLLAFSRTASAVIVPTLPDPGWENGTTAAYTAINYDYGPRVVSSGSNPHVGIDYDIRTGAKAYAVSGQSITAISAAGDNSLIQTGMWRYIHMVIDGPYVQTATYPAGNTVLIFREGNGSGGYNLLKILGRAGVNYLDDYHDPVSNQDAPVQTAVSQGEWLFVSNSLNHLHLDINNGEENPLKYVKHRDEANPVLWPKYRFFDTSAITDFSDNVLFNHGANPVLLQLGSDVRTDKDLNSVEMLIKPAGGAYASLDKWTYEPYGGYQGYVNTVSGERNTIWLSGDLESIRNSSFEGVYPLEGMNNESFDFFKLQWNTRQKASGTGLTLLNSEAKWPDGDYSVKMIAKDATEHEAFTEEQKQVDNFRPFLKMVGIEGSEAKYYKEWTFSGTTLSCDGPLVNKPLGDGDYTITLEFSEPVINPTAFIDTYGVLQLIPAGNQKNFSANLSVGGASGIQDGLRTLTVTATDLSGNKILILNPAKKIINPNSELTRDPASGVMQGTGGDDTSVDFTINTAPPIVEFLEPLAEIYDLNVVASPLALVAGTASKELASVEVGLSHLDGTWWDGHAWTPTEVYHAGNFAYTDPDGQPGNFWFYSGFDGVDNSRVELSNTYTLHVKALDLAGQVAAPKQQVITIQKAEATEPGAYIDSLNGIHGYIDPYSVHSSFTGIDGHTVGSTDKVQLSITRMDDGYGWNGNAWSNIPDAACSPYNQVCLNNIGISSNKWEYSTGLPTLETGKLYQIKALGYKDFGVQPDPMPSELWFCYSLPSQQQRCLYKGSDEKTLIFDKTPPVVAIDAIDFTVSDFASKVNLTVGGTIGNDETGAIPDAASAQVSIIDVTDPSLQKYWNGSAWITGENIMFLGANYNKDADKWIYNMVGGALSKNKQYVIRARAIDIAGNQSIVKKRPLNITLLSAALLDMYSLLNGQIVSNHSLTLNVITTMLERAKNALLAANLRYFAHLGFDVAGSDVVLKYPVSPETLAQYPPERLGVYRFVPGGLPAEDTLEQVYSYFDPVESVLYAYTDVSGLYLMAASGPANTDSTPPVTELTSSGKYTDGAGKVYISAVSQVTLTAVEDYPQTIYRVYKFDPTAALLEAGLNSDTKGQFTQYTGEFSIEAGVQTLAYGSYNESGLYETLKTVYVDATAPLTNILVAGVVVNNGVIEAQEGAAITFGRSDDGEISSGPKDTFYRVDNGAYTKYEQAVILPVGEYTIQYYSVDNVGNRELTDGVAQITIIADTTPPVTRLMVNGQEITDGASADILDNDDISVLAEDSSGSGVTVYYSKDTALTPETRIQYLGQPFVLPPGTHIVYYTAYDTAGNMAAIKSANFNVTQNLDTTPPFSSLIRVGEHFSNGNGDFVAPSTLLHVYATDNNPGVNSGLDKTYYKVAGPGDTLPGTLDAQTAVLFNTEPPDFALLPEEEWRVAYGASDLAGNYSQMQVETIYSDGTPPVVDLTITGTIGQNGWYVSAVAGVVDVTDAKSGVRNTSYILNNTKWPGPRGVNVGSGQIADEDGVYSGLLRAFDNVGNLTELPLSFKIDKTPPATQASIHGNCNNEGCDPGVSVALNTADATSGPGNIYYSLDNGPYGGYSGPIAFDTDGQYTIRYYATDQAGNTEATKTVNVKVRTRPGFTTYWIEGISIGGVLSGNTSIPVAGEVVSPPVTIPASPVPPTLDLGESGSLFLDWRGVNTNTAHTIETEFPLTIKDTDDGLKSVVITGPGVAIDQQYEVPDISVIYQYSFSGLEPGLYNITATDKQGNVTSVMFEIGTLDIIPAQTRSAGVYDAVEDTFTARVEADFASSFGLAGAEYFVDGSTETIPLSGASASEKFYSKKGFKAYNFDPPAVLTPYLPEARDYGIRVIDRYGYYKALAYNITGEGNSSYSHPTIGTSIETPITDVLSVYPADSNQVLLPGAMRPLKDILSYGELLWSRNLWSESGYNTDPGVCVPHSGNFGSINFQVKSGDSSVALTEDAVLTRTLYFATYSSPNPPPNCVKFSADGGSQCPAHPGTEHAVCYQDVYSVPGVPAVPPITAVPSKRFYQVQAAASDSSINVFVSNGVDDHPLAAGYPFSKRFSVSAGFNDYLWGLVLKTEDIKGGSNLAPEGQNVAVKMGGVLDVAIDSVLNAGQSALTMTSASLPNGRISLSGGIAWRLLPRLGASPETGGYITLSFQLGPEYTSLTQEQKEGIRVFKITDGVYEMLPTDVDAAAGKATVAVQSLYGSSYMLTAPAYSAAYSSETEEMGVISGDPEAVAGRHGRIFQQGQSISAALGARLGLAPVTDFYDISSPVGTVFTPAATIVFAAVAGAETAHLYGFNADATVVERLPEQIITIAGRRYHAASVAQTHPYYALLQQAPVQPVTGFTPTGPMTSVRLIHTETLLLNGKVLITGGRNGGASLSSAELYDPVSKTFTATGSMSAARAWHTATLLANGKVLVAGGSNLSSAELYDPASGTFAPTGSMSAARGDHTATLLPNGKVLITGGYAGGAILSSAELYDPASGTFASINSMSVRRTNHTATLLASGKVLIAGGHGDISSAELYDPATGLFTNTGPMSFVRGYQAAALLPNGKVLLVGGLGAGFSYSASADLYDPVTGTFAATGSMSTVRNQPVAVLLPTGKVLVAGGSNGVANLSTAEIYDPVAGTFSTAASMSTGRDNHAATLLADGKVLITGGASQPSAEVYDSGFSAPVNIVLTSIVVTPSSATVDVGVMQQFTATGNFNNGSSRVLGAMDGLAWTVIPDTVAAVSMDGLATGIGAGTARIMVSSGIISAEASLTVGVIPPVAGFSATGSMLAARGIHTETLLPNGKVLIVGGRNGEGVVSSAELYDPVAKTFTATGSMNTPRAWHAATLLPNGKVLVSGGSNPGGEFSSAELYDPAAGTFSLTGSMSNIRSGHIAILLPNGKVLVAGGYNGSIYNSSAELYDPAAGTFAATGSMRIGRGQYSATLLPNGKVLVAGGDGPGGPTTALADLYDPAAGTFSATGSMGEARFRHSATLLPSGKVLVAGGANSGGTLSSAELYDPATGDFSPTGSMGWVRQSLTATLLANGKVLIAAGSDDSAPLSSAELYDPVAGAFSTTGSLLSPRSSHGATLLADGKVLVTGGHDGAGFVSSAELYDSGASGPVSIVLASISLTPSSATVDVGATRQFTAMGNFSDGSSRALGAGDGVEWIVGNVGVAFIDGNGLVSGVTPGETIIVASSGAINGSAAVYVPDPPIESSDGLVSIATLGEEIFVSSMPTADIPSTAPVFTAMTSLSLQPVMPAIYEFEPSGVQFAVPVTITFTFDPVNVDTTTVAIYYFDGQSWSTSAVANQRFTFGADGLVTVSGEIAHTSLYALLRVNTAPKVAIDLDPDTMNLKSKGGVITAGLHMTNGSSGCFRRETLNISAVNGRVLAQPIFAQEKSGKGYTLDCGSVTVKFSRDAVAAVLPANAVATVTVSGVFADGSGFQAEDTVRTINPVRASEGGGFFAEAAGAEFRLGEVYVYPNPAKGGKVPVFHVEVGAADTVKIRVYTVAGQVVHEKTLAGAPQVIGPAYAYEYAWAGHIASGVYYYTIEAERTGKKLKFRGKFAVVR